MVLYFFRAFLGPRGLLGTPSSARPSVGAKNLDQLYSSMYASQTHITIHIPKAHDKYYPLTPRDDNDKYTRKNKDKDKQSGQWGSED